MREWTLTLHRPKRHQMVSGYFPRASHRCPHSICSHLYLRLLITVRPLLRCTKWRGNKFDLKKNENLNNFFLILSQDQYREVVIIILKDTWRKFAIHSFENKKKRIILTYKEPFLMNCIGEKPPHSESDNFVYKMLDKCFPFRHIPREF